MSGHSKWNNICLLYTSYTLHIELWIFIHGIASMLVTGYLNLEETVISTMVTDVYQGLLARKKEETA